jgi:hypothetical protein
MIDGRRDRLASCFFDIRLTYWSGSAQQCFVSMGADELARPPLAFVLHVPKILN